uniref:zinc finger and SCAN domain-containing protein 2-like isoform X2 n=1 Tax=Doryrhamphus excisus TaxID=161450 RepID=UPI0025ADE9EE|nr:zinc finger and SCAN domain-containing protein 2-like isoform X2 [Doryrhamphus excisus]
MLEELVKERLVAVADEILALLERTMPSYEEELPPTREEKGRHGRQQEAVGKTHVVFHGEDFQQLIGHQEEPPIERHGGRSTLKQEDHQPPHVKEEEEELWVTQEERGAGIPDSIEDHEDEPPEFSQLHHSPGEEKGEAELPGRNHGGGSALKTLKELVKERLMVAANEILALLERTIASYENELPPTPEEKERHGRQQEAASKTLVVFRGEDVQQIIGCQEDSPLPKHEEPQPPHLKDEEEEQWVTQEGEEADLATLPLTVISVKTEEHEDKPPRSSHPHGDHCGGSPADKRLAPLSDSDGDHRGGSPADKRLAPLSDSEHTMSRVPTRTGEKPFSCSVCDKRFSVKRNMLSHTRRHTNEKLFSCSDCGKKFFQKVHMLLHMRTHTGEKPFSCSDCGKSFTQKVNMLAHMRTHTEEKLFSCSDCGKKFFQKVHMLSHMRTHTGEKPFSCSDCGKSFTQKVNMLSHMRTHTGEKPFSCSDCGKAFSHQAHMRTHMRTHTGEKPFRCSACGDEFSRKSSLNRHMQSH